MTAATLLKKEELRGSGNLSSDSLGDLIRVMRKFQNLVQPDGNGDPLRYRHQKEDSRNA
jgi:hypothetical protein